MLITGVFITSLEYIVTRVFHQQKNGIGREFMQLLCFSIRCPDLRIRTYKSVGLVFGSILPLSIFLTLYHFYIPVCGFVSLYNRGCSIDFVSLPYTQSWLTNYSYHFYVNFNLYLFNMKSFDIRFIGIFNISRPVFSKSYFFYICNQPFNESLPSYIPCPEFVSILG